MSFTRWALLAIAAVVEAWVLWIVGGALFLLGEACHEKVATSAVVIGELSFFVLVLIGYLGWIVGAYRTRYWWPMMLLGLLATLPAWAFLIGGFRPSFWEHCSVTF